MEFKTEAQMQAYCTQWFHNNFISLRQMLFCVDNNSGTRNEGSIKKALGVRKGVADLVFIGYMFVVFIELKLPNGVQSPEQKEFNKKVLDRGHYYRVVRTFNEFEDLIRSLINESNNLQNG